MTAPVDLLSVVRDRVCQSAHLITTQAASEPPGRPIERAHRTADVLIGLEIALEHIDAVARTEDAP